MRILILFLIVSVTLYAEDKNLVVVGGKEIVLGGRVQRSPAEALKYLPKKWHGVEHLPEGFPKDYEPPITGKFDSGTGKIIDFNQLLSPEALKRLNERGKRGEFFKVYGEKKGSERYKAGPGISGKEYLAGAKANRWEKSPEHVFFLYGQGKGNAWRDYMLYRITGDSWYIEDLCCWADAIIWHYENKPDVFIPIPKRGEATFGKEHHKLGHFFGIMAASRLLLDEAKKRGTGLDDPSVQKAKRYYDYAFPRMGPTVTGPYPKTYGRGFEFKPGVRTLELVHKYGIPPRSAARIEYQPWNQSVGGFTVMVMAACAAESLHTLTGDPSYKETSNLYARITSTAFTKLQREGDAVIDKEGVPYFWSTHTPSRDKPPVADSKHPHKGTFLGHPMFGGEDNGHSSGMANELPNVWEGGKRFGCPTALMAGHANVMADALLNPNSFNKKTKPPTLKFHSHLDSPWYQAKIRPHGYPGKHAGTKYLQTIAFAPELLVGRRKYVPRENPKKGDHQFAMELRMEFGRYLYQKWKKEYR